MGTIHLWALVALTIFSINTHGFGFADPICTNLFSIKSNSPVRSYDNSKNELLNAISKITQISPNKNELDAIESVVYQAAEAIGLPKEFANEISLRARKVAAEALNIPWQVASGGKKISKKKLLAALEKLLQLTEVDTSFDIPYLAGYSNLNPSRIYIDRGLKTTQRILYADVQLIPFLAVHERIEKALIDILPIQIDRYLIPHQIAQRIEKEMVIAAGISWDSYQNEIMKREIKRAENPQRKYLRVPKDLDLTPYLEAGDFATIQKMQIRMQDTYRSDSFDYRIAYPGVLHLEFYDQATMAFMMMRFQEYYESPKFSGKIFTRKQFLDWFRKKKNGFSSYSEWDGFNFPIEVLEPFYKGKFTPLSRDEEKLLRVLKKFRHAKFYIVASLKNNEGVYSHEIAHSLF